MGPFDSPVGKDIPYKHSITARRDSLLHAPSDYKQFIHW